MKTTTGAASAAGFALVLILFLNARDANAQQAVAASTYQQPTVASATMTEAPQAPTLQGASCGTIGPQTEETAMVVGVSAERSVEVGSGKFDGSALLQGFSAGINQFKGKIAEKAFSFLGSLQNKGQAPIIPSGYSLTRVTAPVPPAVF